MAVSANALTDFSRDQILTMALQLARQLPAGSEAAAEDLEMGANFLSLELGSLQAEGVLLQTTERTTQSLTVAAGASYTLDSDTIDVRLGANDQAGVVKPSGGDDSIVKAISRAEYQDISDKTSSGRPSVVYIEKQASVKLVFWPVPDATYTFSYSKVRLLRAVDSGAVTIDLARRWLQAMTYAVASQVAMAKSMPIEVVGFLRSEAERLKAICRADDQERPKIKFRLAHRGRFW